MRSNPAIKRRVAAGQLCYICERNPPTLRDVIGGPLCEQCAQGIVAMQRKYALQGGYHERKNPARKRGM